jgi:hypothetical protein
MRLLRLGENSRQAAITIIITKIQLAECVPYDVLITPNKMLAGMNNIRITELTADAAPARTRDGKLSCRSVVSSTERATKLVPMKVCAHRINHVTTFSVNTIALAKSATNAIMVAFRRWFLCDPQDSRQYR